MSYRSNILIFCIIVVLLTVITYITLDTKITSIHERYYSYRESLIKFLSKDLNNLIKRQSDLSSKLNNLLLEENVAYAIIQLSSGEVLAKAESNYISLGVLTSIETEALKTSNFKFVSFTDPSQSIALCEGIMPFISETGKKYILRVGFFKDKEIDEVNNIKFQYFIVFLLLLFVVIFVWFSNFFTWVGYQKILLATVFIVFGLLLLVHIYYLNQWYINLWRKNFIQHGFSVAKIIAIPAKRFLFTGDESDLREMNTCFDDDERFSYMAVIKDEQYLYHSDPELKGKSFVPNEKYSRSLNTSKPVFFTENNDEYELYIPIMHEQKRLGTLCIGFKSFRKSDIYSFTNHRLIFILFAAFGCIVFAVIYVFKMLKNDMNLLLHGLEKVTSGDLQYQVLINRDDEIGQISQAFNLMVINLRERDIVNKSLHNYVTKALLDKTLKVISQTERKGERISTASVLIHFSSFNEIVQNISPEKLFLEFKQLFFDLKKLVQNKHNNCIIPLPIGILIVFAQNTKHETIVQALQFIQLAKHIVQKYHDSMLNPKISVHVTDLIYGELEDPNYSKIFLGEPYSDFEAFASVQDTTEVIFSSSAYNLLKDIAIFDEIEIFSSSQKRVKGYIFRSYKNLQHLIEAFYNNNVWVKILVIRLMKLLNEKVPLQQLIEWYHNSDAEVRFHIIDLIDQLSYQNAIDFVISVVQNERDPKVLARSVSLLGKIGNETHINILTEKLNTCTDRRVKANIIEALESIGGRRVYEFLNLMIDEQDNRVKANILIALGKYGDLRVFDLLSKMIKDPDSNMRASAAYALGKLGMIQGIEPLMSALSDKDPIVRKQVIAALSALKADLELGY